MSKKAIVVLFFLLLVLGQIPGLLFQIQFGTSFRIQPVDVLIVCVAMYTLYKQFPIPRVIMPFLEFATFGVVVTFISPILFPISINIESILFSLRILSYGMFMVYIANQKVTTDFLYKTALLSVVLLATAGWIQYIFSPDMRWLAGLGWDDHYYRMIGTLLDPAFLGIFLVFGSIIAITLRSTPALLFLILSLAFTYSRASWLAIGVGLTYFLIKKYEVKLTIFAFITLALSVLILPNPGGEGVNLMRTNSINQKTDNYSHSLSLIKSSPLLGWGTGNICSAKSLLNIEATTNSCRGLDNSLLFVFATTGILGSIFFLRFAFGIYMQKLDTAFVASLIVLVTHSLFTNTLFYPFVLGWFAIMLGSQRNVLRSVTQR